MTQSALAPMSSGDPAAGPVMEALKARARQWLSQFPSDQPVLVIPIFNALDYVLACIESLAVTTDPRVPVLLVDDASTDPAVEPTLSDTAAFGPQFGYFRKPSNSGFVGSVNFGFEVGDRRDVVLINSDTTYPLDWLPRLQAAAYSNSTVATATPLTNHGSLLSVPFRDRPVGHIEGGFSVTEADARIAAAAKRLYPLLPTAIGHCTYVRRSALDVVGLLDWAFVPGYGEEVDFSQRAVTLGYSHVAADDIFIFHAGAKSFSADGQAKAQRIKDAHEALINKRYPWYRAWVADVSMDESGPLAEALERAARALRGPRIALDATFLAPTTTGTSVVSLELIRALGMSSKEGEHLTVLVRSDWPEAKRIELADHVDEVRSVGDFHELAGPQFDLIFRPCQAHSAGDLLRLRTLARRFVIMELDFIAYANPSYQRSYAEWQRYRYVTELSMTMADGVAFNSADVRADGARRGLHVPDDRMVIAHNGVDHHFHQGEAQRPPGTEALTPQGFLLVLGTNFKHKNRVQAIRIAEVLLEEHGWDGRLVFAGPTVAMGGDEQEVAAALAVSPHTAARFVRLGAVSEAEKRWLLENAAVVLYPSTAEGFGLIPFEAAAAGTPTLTPAVTSLPEVMGDDALFLPSEPRAAAAVVKKFLRDPETARRQVELLLMRRGDFRWPLVADRVRGLWQTVFDLPPRSSLRREEIALLRRLILPGAVDGEGAAKNWVQRLRLAAHILRTEGPGALWAEMKQFLRWIFGSL